MKKSKKVLSVVLVFLISFFTVMANLPAQAAEKKIVVPEVRFATAPTTEYTVGERVNFNIYSPNYGGRVEYRVVLWNDARKTYYDLWNPSNGYPTRYYTKWQPYGNNIFTLGWIINEPGSYRITVYAKRVGIPSSKGALKGMNCDSYMESVAFRVKSKEATVQALMPLADVTVNQGNTPVLPSTVKAVMSDGTEKNLRVTWNPVDTTRPGTFTIEGIVEGTSLKAYLRLTVNGLSVMNVQKVEALSQSVVNVSLVQAIDFIPNINRFALKQYGGSTGRIYSLSMSTDKKTIYLQTDYMTVGTWYVLTVDGRDYAFNLSTSGYGNITLSARDITVPALGYAYPDITVSPRDAALSFTSYDERIARYDAVSGKIVGVAPGRTTFYVSATKSGYTSANDTFIVEVVGSASSLSAEPATLYESYANDGTLSPDVITVKTTNNYFSNYIDKSDVRIQNLPNGLDFDVEFVDYSTIKIHLLDSATNHSNSYDTNIRVLVYQSGLLEDVNNYLASNYIRIDFDTFRALPASFEATGLAGMNGGKAYAQFKLMYENQVISLADTNVDSIKEKAPGQSVPTTLTADSDSTLWFNIERASGDYTYSITTKDGRRYEAVISWGPRRTYTKATDITENATGTELRIRLKSSSYNVITTDGNMYLSDGDTIMELDGTSGIDYYALETHPTIPGVVRIPAGTYKVYIPVDGGWYYLTFRTQAIPGETSWSKLIAVNSLTIQ